LRRDRRHIDTQLARQNGHEFLAPVADNVGHHRDSAHDAGGEDLGLEMPSLS
jgi:hypothetical protein